MTLTLWLVDKISVELTEPNLFHFFFKYILKLCIRLKLLTEEKHFKLINTHLLTMYNI